MGKKTFMATTTIILALLISTVAGIQTANLAGANPVPLIPPTSPITEPPQIVIQSPSSGTYESPDVPLNFTVTGCRHGLTSPSPNIKDYHLDYVDYEIDGKEVYLNFSDVLDNQSFPEVLTGLANGNHLVTINVVAVSTYATNIISLGNNTYRYTENYYYPQVSQTIDFTVDINLASSPIPNSVVTPHVPDFNVTFVGQPRNGTIVLTIKNQPINNPVAGEYFYYYYNVRDKGHNVSDQYWNHFYSGPNTAVQLALPISSNSQYTTLTYSADDYQSGYQIDYQVQILVATDVHVFPNMNFSDGQWERQIVGQSDWSNTQTVTIPAALSSESPSPTLTLSPIVIPSESPTQQPTTEPPPTQNLGPPPPNEGNPSLFSIVFIIAVVVIIAIGVAGYMNFKKKGSNKKGN